MNGSSTQRQMNGWRDHELMKERIEATQCVKSALRDLESSFSCSESKKIKICTKCCVLHSNKVINEEAFFAGFFTLCTFTIECRATDTIDVGYLNYALHFEASPRVVFLCTK